MDDIKDIVNKLGCFHNRIETLYLCRPDLPFDSCLVAIEGNEVARKLIELLTTVKLVCVYVEHIYNDIGGGG